MSDIVGECTICGVDLYDQEETYAITAGIMKKDMDGFCCSDATPWEEVMCIECMDEIDKAFLMIRERQHALRERNIRNEPDTNIRSGNTGNEPTADRIAG